MSAGSLNGGVLSVSKLVVGGATFTGGSGVSGLSTSPATSTTTANPVPFSATWDDTATAGTAPTAVFTATAGGMALDITTPAFGGGGGGITSLATTPATVPTTSATPALSATITQNAGTATAVFTGSAGGVALAINVPPGTGTGITSLLTTPATVATTSATPALTVGTLTTTSSATTLAFTGSAGGLSLGGNIQVASSGGSVPTAIINPGATVGTNPANPSWVAPVAPATSPYTLTLTNAQLEVCRVGSTAFPAQTAIFQNAVWSGGFQLIGTNAIPIGVLCLPQYNPTAGVNPTTYVFQTNANPGNNAIAVQLLYAGS